MPAASNVVKQSWIPRGEGKGGHFTNSTYHDQPADSTYSLTNSILKNNGWTVQPKASLFGSSASGPVTTLDIFNRYTGNSQALVSSVIAGVTNDGAGRSKVINQTSAAVIRSSASALPTTGTGRYVFATVKNRLYMANGTDIPAISPDATASSCIPWGKSPQATALSYQISAPGTGVNAYVVGGTQGTCNAAAGVNPTITWVSGPTFEYFKAGQTVYINGLPYVILVWTDNTHFTVTSAGIPGAPLAGVPYSYAPTGISTGNASGAPGSVTVTGTGGVQATGNTAGAVLTWATGVKFDTILVGSTIYLTTGGVTQTFTVATITSATVLTLSGVPGNALYNISYGVVAGGTTIAGLNTLTLWNGSGAGAPALNGAPVTNGSPIYIATGAALTSTPTVKYLISNTSAPATGAISTTYAEATGGVAVTRAAQVNFGNISFENASYTYAVSYYNFTSGHVTNPSAIMSVKDGAPNNSNVNITISGIKTTNDTAYNYIILWRSVKGGSNLFPLVVLNNNMGNVTGNFITYTDILGDDTALGTCLAPGQATGPGKVVAPRGENSPPPSDLNLIAYWDGRFWGASQTQIGLLFFSARSSNNNEDVSVGVPEECWPLNFTRPIPEADGRITGLRTVGNNLFVLTDNSIYAVTGGAQTNYGLSKVSSKGKGTSHFATCVIPGEDVNSTDVLVHFGNDGRLYFLFGSGGDFCISYPIQSELDAISPTAAGATVGVIHTSVSTYVTLVPVSGGYQYSYDLERKVWLKSSSQFYGTGRCEALYNGTNSQFFSANPLGTNDVWLDNQFTAPLAPYTITTNWTPFVSEDRKGNKSLQSVTVYTNTAAGNVSATVSIDGGSPVTLTQVPNTGAYSTAYHEYSDAIMFVPQTALQGRLFQFVVTSGNTAIGGYSEYVYEIGAAATYSQSDEAKGANL